MVSHIITGHLTLNYLSCLGYFLRSHVLSLYHFLVLAYTKQVQFIKFLFYHSSMNVSIIIQRTRNILRNLKNTIGNVPALARDRIQMMMTAIQRKKDSDQNPILLQNILLVLNLREVTRNQKSIRRKAKRGDINLTLQNQILNERRIKKKKIGKVKKTEVDRDQNQNTNHLRKRLERILVTGILLAVNWVKGNWKSAEEPFWSNWMMINKLYQIYVYSMI